MIYQKSIMGIKGNLVVFLLSFAFTLSESRHVTICPGAKLNKSSFPHGFVFGSATSAYQIEGAADEGGRGPSIWDNFIRQYPNKIKDGSNATVAVDSYHRYKEDVEMMRYMGLDAYRFSISWPRVLPYGKLSRGVNKEGINYYNDLIDELLKNGIVPFVTLFHWDLPQDLEDEYDGFLSNKIVDDFRNFADLCFREFGDRVKNWITLNEPWSFSYGGYESSLFAPGRCSSWQNLNCTKGNSSTEPYLAAHNQLLSHAAAVKLYRRRYQKIQKGKIGIALVTEWFVPKSHSPKNHDATQRALDFMFGWFMDPIATGDYPESMRSHVNDRLPNFTEEDSKMLKGSFDFIGINYYSAKYVYDLSNSSSTNISYTNDAQLNKTCERHGIPLGKPGGSSWLTVYPRGILDLLLYIKIKYKNPIIYITENGIDELNNATLSIEQALNDTTRENYYKDHLCFLRQAIENHVNVKGYFAWSLMDNFEWSSGYSVRFGLNYVDYDNGLKRIPKNSAKWFKKFLHHDEISDYQPRISDQ